MRARRFREPRGFGHGAGIAAGDLDDMQRKPVALGAQARFLVGGKIEAGRDHLGDDQARAEPRGHAPHAEIGNARHGSQKGRRLDLPRAQDDGLRSLGAQALGICIHAYTIDIMLRCAKSQS